MEILIDHRESNAAVAGHLKQFPNTSIRFEHLSIGDYHVDGLFLIERKTLPDLIASIKEGRIFDQACRPAAAHQQSIIILEGTSSAIQHSQMRREAIQGVLIKISVFLKIPLLRI